MINQKSDGMLIGICSLNVIYTKGIQSLLYELKYIKATYVSNVQTEMITMAARKHPDIILIKDWEEPNDFVYVVQRMREVNPNSKVVVFLSNIKNQKSLMSACESRADAILDAQTDLVTIEEALNALIRGEAYISTSVAKHLLHYVVGLLTFIKRNGDIMGAEVLTKRENEIFELMRKGRKNHEIASHLSISVNTVHNHVVNISKKLRLRDKREIIDFLPPENKVSAKSSISSSRELSGYGVLDRFLEQIKNSSNVLRNDERYNYGSQKK
ncbi:MAG: response regulator transcription factor [Dehalobacterium sp.]